MSKDNAWNEIDFQGPSKKNEAPGKDRLAQEAADAWRSEVDNKGIQPSADHSIATTPSVNSNTGITSSDGKARPTIVKERTRSEHPDHDRVMAHAAGSASTPVQSEKAPVQSEQKQASAALAKSNVDAPTASTGAQPVRAEREVKSTPVEVHQNMTERKSTEPSVVATTQPVSAPQRTEAQQPAAPVSVERARGFEQLGAAKQTDIVLPRKDNVVAMMPVRETTGAQEHVIKQVDLSPTREESGNASTEGRRSIEQEASCASTGRRRSIEQEQSGTSTEGRRSIEQEQSGTSTGRRRSVDPDIRTHEPVQFKETKVAGAPENPRDTEISVKASKSKEPEGAPSAGWKYVNHEPRLLIFEPKSKQIEATNSETKQPQEERNRRINVWLDEVVKRAAGKPLSDSSEKGSRVIAWLDDVVKRTPGKQTSLPSDKASKVLVWLDDVSKKFAGQVPFKTDKRDDKQEKLPEITANQDLRPLRDTKVKLEITRMIREIQSGTVKATGIQTALVNLVSEIGGKNIDAAVKALRTSERGAMPDWSEVEPTQRGQVKLLVRICLAMQNENARAVQKKDNVVIESVKQIKTSINHVIQDVVTALRLPTIEVTVRRASDTSANCDRCGRSTQHGAQCETCTVSSQERSKIRKSIQENAVFVLPPKGRKSVRIQPSRGKLSDHAARALDDESNKNETSRN